MNQFWCHQCNLSFSSDAEAGSVHCPNCDGEFVEQIEAEQATVAESMAGLGTADPRLFAMTNMIASALNGSSQSLDDEEDEEHDDDDDSVAGGDIEEMFRPFMGQMSQQNGMDPLLQMMNILTGGQIPLVRQRTSSQGQPASNSQPTQPAESNAADSSEGSPRRSRQPTGYRMTVNYSPDGGATIRTTTFDGESSTTTTSVQPPGEDTEAQTNTETETAEGEAAEPARGPGRIFVGAVPLGGRMGTADNNPVQVDFPTLLQQIFSQAYGPAMGGGDEFAAGMNPLFQMMGMTGNPGDYVTSQRGLDDVLSRLMEQTQGKNVPPPATDDMISNLPREPATVADLDVQKECPVCQDDFELGKDMVIMPCKHRFHSVCLKHWLKINGTCPVCRFSLITGKKHDHSQDHLNQPDTSSSNPAPPSSSSTSYSSTVNPSTSADRRETADRSRSRSPQRQ